MGWALWFMPVISAIQEVEIRRTAVQGQPGQNVSKTPFHLNIKAGCGVHTTYDPSY
jgi:hypothetical protein